MNKIAKKNEIITSLSMDKHVVKPVSSYK